MIVWTKKYIPESLSDVVGNDYVIKKLKKWASVWAEGKFQMPLLLSGPTGVGKTASVYALAHDFNFELLETNASEVRKKDVVEKLLGAASQSCTLSGKKKIILIDEVDVLQGNSDRGGASAILNVLKSACVPIILTANDAYSRSLQAIRKNCKVTKFKELNYHDIVKKLVFIAKEESVSVEQSVLETLARDSNGDLRSCINDLQVMSAGEKIISKESLNVLGFRERSQNVKEAIQIVFNSKNFQEIRSANWSTSVDPDLFKKWIVENVPYEYKGLDVVSAMNQLSRADVFDGRISKRQYYGFMKYSNDLVTTGVAFSKSVQYNRPAEYRFPSFILKLSAQKSENVLKKEIGAKISLKSHVSVKDAVSSTLPYLTQMFEKKEFAVGLVAFFGFNNKEVAFILRKNPLSTEVKQICELAKEIEQKNIRENIHLIKKTSFWSDSVTVNKEVKKKKVISVKEDELKKLVINKDNKEANEIKEKVKKSVDLDKKNSNAVQTNLFGF